MKWYHKAVYRFANAVLPNAVKQQMMGMGRLTVPSNANPYNMFNWLPKKFQKAHNIDLTKLQSYTAEELLEMLVSVHPDISHAVHMYLRMGDTPLSFEAKKENRKSDAMGQRTVDEIKTMLNTEAASPGYQHGRSIDKLDGIQRLMVMVRGACAGEVVLNDTCNDVVDIVPVDPALIWFRREPNTNRLIPWQYVRNPRMKPGEEWFGQYKKIDTPTFIYEELDPLVDDPYGRTPILPVLQIVFFHLQVLQDLKAVVHNQGYPRMHVKMIEEVMLKNMPNQLKNDPNAQREWLKKRMEDVQNMFSSLNPDDALFGWDSVEYKYIEGGGKGPMIDVSKLINVIDTQLATSLKTLLTLLSRHQGSTETYSSVDTQLYIKTVESARSVTRRFWERAFSLAARVKGIQTNVEVEYAPIDLRTENEVEKDRQLRLENLESAESNYYITPEEAAEETRKTLGINSKIPAELKDKLKNKHEQPATPPQENPANPPNPPQPSNLRVIKLDNTGDNQEEESPEEKYMALILLLLLANQRTMMQATSVESVLATMRLGDGTKSRLITGLWQLYRSKYVQSYNERAGQTGTSKILHPDTETSVQLHTKARNVVEGVLNTYHDLLQSSYQKAKEEAGALPEEEQLNAVKSAMSTWAEENASYKAVQISQREGIEAYHEGMFDHDKANVPDTLYEVQPSGTEHEACAEIIAGGPYTLGEAMSLTLPLHPNCPHHFVPIGRE